MRTSPTAVSAKLKAAGFGIVATRNREGIRVSSGGLGEVRVTVAHDMPRARKRAADALAEELNRWEGYEVRRNDSDSFYIKKMEME